MLIRCTALALGMTLTASAARGQVTIGVIAGFHAPTADFPIPAGGFASGFGPTNAKHEVGFMFGAIARAWIIGPLGLQASVSRATGDLVLSPPFTTAPDTSYSASLTVITGSLLYRLPTGHRSNQVWISAGAAWTRHASSRYAGVDGTSSLGGTLGLGTAFAMGKRLQIELGLDTLFYPYDLKSTTDNPPGHSQLDLRGSAGMSISLPL